MIYNKEDKPGYLIYETGSRYDRLQKVVFVGLPALTFAIGVALLPGSKEDALVLFAITAFYALLFHSISPRKFQIYEDRLRIVLGKPFAFSLSFATIKTFQPASSVKSYIYMGVRWATSSQNVVEIVRHKGMNMVISPSDKESFLDQANDALKKYQQSSSTLK